MKAFSQELINAGAMYEQVDGSETLQALRETAASKKKVIIIDLVKKAIENNGEVAVTTDLWTDSYNRQSFTSCTVQYSLSKGTERDTVKK